MPPAVIFALLCYFNATSATISVVMAGFVLAGSFVCIKYAPGVIAITGKDDPGEVVADEFAGQAVTFLAAGAVASSHIVATAVIGFLLFRFFDILKPWPIRKLEKFPAGWGILADDLLAGVYAAVILKFCSLFLISRFIV